MRDKIIRVTIESNPPDEFVVIQTGRKENEVWLHIDDVPRVVAILQRLLTQRAADGAYETLKVIGNATYCKNCGHWLWREAPRE